MRYCFITPISIAAYRLYMFEKLMNKMGWGGMGGVR